MSKCVDVVQSSTHGRRNDIHIQNKGRKKDLRRWTGTEDIYEDPWFLNISMCICMYVYVGIYVYEYVYIYICVCTLRSPAPGQNLVVVFHDPPYAITDRHFNNNIWRLQYPQFK